MTHVNKELNIICKQLVSHAKGFFEFAFDKWIMPHNMLFIYQVERLLMSNLTPNPTEVNFIWNVNIKRFKGAAVLCKYWFKWNIVKIAIANKSKWKSNQSTKCPNVCREQYFSTLFCKRRLRQRVYFVDCHSKGFTETEMTQWIFQYFKEQTRFTFLRSHVFWYLYVFHLDDGFVLFEWGIACITITIVMIPCMIIMICMYGNRIWCDILENICCRYKSISSSWFSYRQKKENCRILANTSNESEIFRFVPFYTLHFAIKCLRVWFQ